MGYSVCLVVITYVQYFRILWISVHHIRHYPLWTISRRCMVRLRVSRSSAELCHTYGCIGLCYLCAKQRCSDGRSILGSQQCPNLPNSQLDLRLSFCEPRTLRKTGHDECIHRSYSTNLYIEFTVLGILTTFFTGYCAARLCIHLLSTYGRTFWNKGFSPNQMVDRGLQGLVQESIYINYF